MLRFRADPQVQSGVGSGHRNRTIEIDPKSQCLARLINLVRRYIDRAYKWRALIYIQRHISPRNRRTACGGDQPNICAVKHPAPVPFLAPCAARKGIYSCHRTGLAIHSNQLIRFVRNQPNMLPIKYGPTKGIIRFFETLWPV